ncbi:MAG: adenylyl-sulfate kinase [Actinobacteria bacterium]|nr:adenylyl-sulfate kinase [Actinomycetota bacterium]MBI3257705.1 adenylyl-sulfate kinase [Actinomycetota bacterium]
MVADPDRNITWHHSELSREQRWQALGLRGATVWLTGLSGSGKSTVAVALESRLVAEGRAAYLLDGDNIRHGLNADLGFSDADRAENVRRNGEIARLMADAGMVAIVPVISPFREGRDRVRRMHEVAGLRFVEVFLDTSLAECEQRDPKGLYAKARSGELSGMTGIDSPYEPPTNPELVLKPTDGSPEELATRVLGFLNEL